MRVLSIHIIIIRRQCGLTTGTSQVLEGGNDSHNGVQHQARDHNAIAKTRESIRDHNHNHSRMHKSASSESNGFNESQNFRG